MAGINTTGIPTPDDYNLGRGRIFAAELAVDDKPLAFRELGNCTSFTLNVEDETLEHQSSMEGLKTTDKEVTVSKKASATVELDEINFDNMAYFFGGTVTTFNNPAGSNGATIGGSGSEVELISAANGGLELGRWYDLYDASNVRVYDIVAADVNLVEDYGGTPNALTLNTDFKVDEKMGRVMVLSTGGATAGLSLGYYLTQSKASPASTVEELQGLQETSKTVCLKFISENPADNEKQTEVQLHKISLKAEGDFALIGDDWTTMSMSGACERSTWTGFSSSPTMNVRTHANA